MMVASSAEGFENAAMEYDEAKERLGDAWMNDDELLDAVGDRMDVMLEMHSVWDLPSARVIADAADEQAAAVAEVPYERLLRMLHLLLASEAIVRRSRTPAPSIVPTGVSRTVPLV